MSLTDFIELPDVKAKFNAEFSKPKFDVKQELLAIPPLNGDARLVGTAFDYLLRFYIKYLNPQAQAGKWIASYALLKLKTTRKNHLCEQVEQVLAQADRNYQQFLTDGQFTDQIIRSAILLAKLDAVIRGGSLLDNWLVVNSEDCQDLRNLIGLLEPSLFKSPCAIILNPHWAEASLLVKGADGDLVINDLLVDIKTVKKLSLERRNFNQLIGYYTLSVIAQNIEPDAIALKRLGIYFSRFGVLYQFNVSDVINLEIFPNFLEWFVVRAREYSGCKLI